MLARYLLCFAILLVGCTSTHVVNEPVQGEVVSKPIRWRASARCMQTAAVFASDNRDQLAQRCLQADPAREHDFFALALSGGGTKAAVFSTESMFYLDALGLLNRTSVLSAVSGGSFAGALYALSCDEGDTSSAACRGPVRSLHRPIWRHADILRVAQQGYDPLAQEQVVRWLVPFARATISADDFASFIDRHYFDTRHPANDRFRFGDLNPRRPTLALNATILSPNRGGLGGLGPDSGQKTQDILGCFGDAAVPRGWLRRRNPDEYFHFAYTDVYFDLLRSNLDNFPISAAVAASAAFPVLIDNATLTDHCRSPSDSDRSLLLADGGTNDNQGLEEIYHVLAELILGQHRSNTPPSSVERLSDGDTAYIFVINSSVTDTTGPSRSGSGVGPVGLLYWISSVVDKVMHAVNVYSATTYNLRKELYVSETRRARQLQQGVLVRPVEIGLDGLDQYRKGGAQAALWQKSGVLNNPAPGDQTDPTLQDLRARAALQRSVLGRVLPGQARKQLQLSDYHPQCYFDVRSKLDASLLNLGEDEKACLREAARWSAALKAQELCEAARTPQGVRAPGGLDCSHGLVALTRPEVLGSPGDVGGSCASVLDKAIAARPATNGPLDEDICARLSD